LVAVLLLLAGFVLAYAYPLRVYLAQQSRIEQMQHAQAKQSERIDELTAKLAQWNDEAFLVGQARSRLHLVREGELLYVVSADPQTPGQPAPAPPAAWYEQLWASLRAADRVEP
jgi:cell division protein FtsB